MIKKLSFYDFDGCLVNSPEPEEGKRIYKEKTGNDYPHKGWWGRKESLKSDIFNINYNEEVYQKYLEDSKEPSTMSVLLTNRMIKLSDEIIKILDDFNIKFDDYSFKSGSKEKVDRIKFYLTIHPNVKIIDIYDDREKELVAFRQLKKEFSDKYQINIHAVENGEIISNKFFTTLNNRIYNLYEYRRLFKEYINKIKL